MTFTTKYDADDEVYFMSENKLKQTTIKRIARIECAENSLSYAVYYMLWNGKLICETSLFSSKIEIINHLTGADL
jgi:hypothetical protein